MVTAMRKKVVEAAVTRLLDMGQMPTGVAADQPDIEVGLEAKVDQVVQLLTATNENTKVVLLHGMGGIGKTTLARAAFNRLHANNPTLPSCFLCLDPDMSEADIMRKQRQLLLELACVTDVTDVSTAEQGRAKLATKLKGKKVLLVVDNVWDTRLEFLLHKDTVRLLGEGSMVLATSREQGAAGLLACKVTEVEMECLSEVPSVELFCKYAFPGSSPGPISYQIQEALKMCAGLPMALEVLGRHFAACGDIYEFDSSFQVACSTQNAGRLEAERTLFGALQLSWNILEPKEKEALLDIVFFLKGQPWSWVRHHCDPYVLRRLGKLGLVKQQEAGANVASIHDTLSFFCRENTAIGGPHERMAVETSCELRQVRGLFGAEPGGCMGLGMDAWWEGHLFARAEEWLL
jgi:hypothetical protein